MHATGSNTQALTSAAAKQHAYLHTQSLEITRQSNEHWQKRINRQEPMKTKMNDTVGAPYNDWPWRAAAVAPRHLPPSASTAHSPLPRSDIHAAAAVVADHGVAKEPRNNYKTNTVKLV
ncbi:hypothetical protein TcCL_Unassigned03186 [Trypanosoma cruzi]|nr:hypothetical protein TcCL_Unassigned03186 [Trypanosoma cruzi]